jgi:hypothetical protein
MLKPAHDCRSQMKLEAVSLKNQENAALSIHAGLSGVKVE